MRPLVLIALASACNQPPSDPAITLVPDQPTTEDDITVAITTEATDPNDNPVVYQFAWTRDGQPADVEGGVVPASVTKKGEVWAVTVSATDGAEASPGVSAEVTVVNALPVAEVSIPDQTPRSDEDLAAVALSEDADEDAVTLKWAWKKNGSPTSITTSTVPASETKRGEVWTVEVTPNDGEGDGEVATADVTVGNLPPQVTAVTLNPLKARVADTFTASARGEDPDGDPLTFTYTWFINDVAQSETGPSLRAGLALKGDSVRVEAIASDGFVDSVAISSGVVVVENTPPTSTGATLTPTKATETTVLTCGGVGLADVDGALDPDNAWRFYFFVNKVLVGTGPTLTGASFQKGDTVSCEAAAWDGEDEGPRIASGAVTIENSAPTLASATLSNTAPAEGDVVYALPGASADADGDAVTFKYDWKVNGVSVGSGPSLSSDLFKKRDLITCTVTPNDGTVDGAPVTTAAATAKNTRPVIDGITLSPTSVFTDTTVSASIVARDIDGDTVSYTYQWLVDGVVKGSGSTLAGTNFAKKNSVWVIATPTDGETAGVAYTSGKVVVLNTAPTKPAISLSPTTPKGSDDLVCNITTASTDLDADTLTYDFIWRLGGKPYTGSTKTKVYAGDTLPESATAPGDTWTCEVSAKDGEVSGASVTASVAVGSFRRFSGATGTAWSTLTHPSSDTYSLQSYATTDFSKYYNTYGSVAQEYNPLTNTWTNKSTSIPYSSPWNSMAPVKSDLWMVRNSRIYKYTPGTDTWTTVTTTTAGDDLNMTESDELGFVYGHGSSGQIVVYDTNLAPSSSNPSYISTGKGSQYETRMGYDPDTGAIFFGDFSKSNLYKYTIATKTVTTMASHPEGQLNDIFCSDRSGHIYAAGSSSGTTIWQYDIAKNTWARIPDLPSDHGNNGSCFVSEDGYLYVGTGSNRTFYRLALL